MDGNRLKFEKNGQVFQLLMPRVPKILKKFIYLLFIIVYYLFIIYYCLLFIYYLL